MKQFCMHCFCPPTWRQLRHMKMLYRPSVVTVAMRELECNLQLTVSLRKNRLESRPELLYQDTFKSWYSINPWRFK